MRSYLITGLLLLLIYLGYSMAKEEEKSLCEEVILSINKGKENILLSKLLVGIIISSFFSLYLIVGQIIATVIVGYGVGILTDIILGYVFYVYVPMILFYIIGLIIGQKVKGYKAYGLIFVIWVLCTSLNLYVFRLFESYLYQSMGITKWFMTLGLYNPEIDIYNPIQGYNINSYIISKFILILCIVLGILLILNFKRSKKNIIVGLILTVLISLSSFEIYDNRYNIEESLKRGEIYNKEEDTSYREGLSTNNYKIEEYDVLVNAGNKTNFDVKLDIEFLERSKDINLTLHENANIEYVKDSKGNNINFKQDGYLLSIDLKNIKDVGEREKLEIKYSIYVIGRTFFVNDDAINLTQDYPYLPLPNLGEVYGVKDGMGTQWSNLSSPSKYKIKVNNNKKVYSNLEETEYNTFEGFSKNGVYLLSSDEIVEEKYKDVTFYYARIAKGDIDIPKCYEDLKKVINTYEEITGIKKDYKRIFMLDNGAKTYEMGEMIITPTRKLIYSDLAYNIIERELLYYQNYSREKNCLLPVLLNRTIEYVYFDNERALEMLKEHSDFYMIDLTFNVEKQRYIQDMICEILESETSNKKDFTRKFYECIRDDGTINGVENFLKSYLKGVEKWEN
ncbi:MAG: hypothetical protein ACRC7N_20245, partial [Clostridium sp.]